MAGYLAVTDERDLTPAGKDVVSKTFLPRSEYAPPATRVPPHAGMRTGAWGAPVYNPDAPALARIRGGIMASLYAGADYEILCIGDSKTGGTGSDTGQRPPQSWPGVLSRALGAVEGFISAMLPAEDARWTATNMNRGGGDMNGLVTTSAGSPSVVTLTHEEPHAGGSFLVQSTAGGTVSVVVDGGATQTLTVPAGAKFQNVTPTVQGDKAHSYAFTGTGTIRLLGFRPAFSTSRLRITNAARAGSTVSDWVPGAVAGVGLWDGYRTAVPQPDAIICQLGTNSPETVAPFSTLWDAILAATKQSVIIAPGGLTGSVYGAMYSTVWDQADRLGLPLVDFASVIGDHEAASALGLKADALHENKRGYAYEAAAMAVLLAPPLPAVASRA